LFVLRWEVIVWFVGIGGIVNHHCLTFLFKIQNTICSRNDIPDKYSLVILLTLPALQSSSWSIYFIVRVSFSFCKIVKSERYFYWIWRSDGMYLSTRTKLVLWSHLFCVRVDVILVWFIYFVVYLFVCLFYSFISSNLVYVIVVF
jgi:hypothetical protein